MRGFEGVTYGVWGWAPSGGQRYGERSGGEVCELCPIGVQGQSPWTPMGHS